MLESGQCGGEAHREHRRLIRRCHAREMLSLDQENLAEKGMSQELGSRGGPPAHLGGKSFQAEGARAKTLRLGLSESIMLIGPILPPHPKFLSLANIA